MAEALDGLGKWAVDADLPDHYRSARSSSYASNATSLPYDGKPPLPDEPVPNVEDDGWEPLWDFTYNACNNCIPVCLVRDVRRDTRTDKATLSLGMTSSTATGIKPPSLLPSPSAMVEALHFAALNAAMRAGRMSSTVSSATLVQAHIADLPESIVCACTRAHRTIIAMALVQTSPDAYTIKPAAAAPAIDTSDWPLLLKNFRKASSAPAPELTDLFCMSCHESLMARRRSKFPPYLSTMIFLDC
jgi:hypothetical protein